MLQNSTLHSKMKHASIYLNLNEIQNKPHPQLHNATFDKKAVTHFT